LAALSYPRPSPYNLKKRKKKIQVNQHTDARTAASLSKAVTRTRENATRGKQRRFADNPEHPQKFSKLLPCQHVRTDRSTAYTVIVKMLEYKHFIPHLLFLSHF